MAVQALCKDCGVVVTPRGSHYCASRGCFVEHDDDFILSRVIVGPTDTVLHVHGIGSNRKGAIMGKLGIALVRFLTR